MQKYFNIKCGLDAQTAKLKHKPKKINFGVVDVKGGAHGRLVPVNIANGLNRIGNSTIPGQVAHLQHPRPCYMSNKTCALVKLRC